MMYYLANIFKSAIVNLRTIYGGVMSFRSQLYSVYLYPLFIFVSILRMLCLAETEYGQFRVVHLTKYCLDILQALMIFQKPLFTFTEFAHPLEGILRQWWSYSMK